MTMERGQPCSRGASRKRYNATRAENAPQTSRDAVTLPSMKLHLQTPTGENMVTGYGPDYVDINGRRQDASLVLLPDQMIHEAFTTFEALDEAQFHGLLALQPELVLLGTGRRQRFPHPSVLRPLMEAKVGVEVMDLQAACRTYNILMGEGRRVAAVLLFD